MLTGKPDAGNPPVRFGGRGGELHPRSYPDLWFALISEMHPDVLRASGKGELKFSVIQFSAFRTAGHRARGCRSAFSSSVWPPEHSVPFFSESLVFPGGHPEHRKLKTPPTGRKL